MQQTTKGYIKYPDGARLITKIKGTGEMLDVGALNSAVNCTLNYTENQVTTANFGKTAMQIREMQMALTFTSISFEAKALEMLSGGMFTRTSVEAGAVATIDNQTIAAGWLDTTNIALELVETGGGDFIPSAAPTITTVTASTAGVLAVDVDYFIVADDNSPTGFSIYFDTTGAAGVTTAESIVIAYTSADAQAGSVLYGGDTTEVLTATEVIIKHVDDSGNIDYLLQIYSANPQSGGFQFNFKGANEDGLDELPLSFLGEIDTTRTSGRQLFKFISPN